MIVSHPTVWIRDSLLVIIVTSLLVHEAPGSGKSAPSQTPDSLVASLYAAVTFGPGASPDWDKVRAMFDSRAVIVLRVARDSTAVMSVDGFVQDFVDFISRARADRTGFRERILKMKPLVFGNIAAVLVLYEASIPGSPRGPQKGVDSFHLAKRDGRWWIVSIVNDVVTKERPVPKELEE